MVPFVVFVTAWQSYHRFDEQVPSFWRSMVLFLSIREASWRLGLICSFPSRTKTFSSVVVVSSNWPLLEATVQSRLPWWAPNQNKPESTDFCLLGPDICVKSSRKVFIKNRTVLLINDDSESVINQQSSKAEPNEHPDHRNYPTHFSRGSFLSSHGRSISPFLTRREWKYFCCFCCWYTLTAEDEPFLDSGVEVNGEWAGICPRRVGMAELTWAADSGGLARVVPAFIAIVEELECSDLSAIACWPVASMRSDGVILEA